jgi:hypothetical protein
VLPEKNWILLTGLEETVIRLPLEAVANVGPVMEPPPVTVPARVMEPVVASRVNWTTPLVL